MVGLTGRRIESLCLVFTHYRMYKQYLPFVHSFFSSFDCDPLYRSSNLINATEPILICNIIENVTQEPQSPGQIP